MRVAVLSDIHSNQYALAAVLDAIAVERVDLFVLLGDMFGYYPWCVDTFRLLKGLTAVAVLGNHDKLVLDSLPPLPAPSYWDVAKQNERELAFDAPEALEWLRSLAPIRVMTLNQHRVICCHGTPDDPLSGRFYPDNVSVPEWSPVSDEIVLLGHTHYPLVRWTHTGGLIANPGSVGQPRDGDQRASWGLLSLPELRFEVRRTEYDVTQAIRLLEKQRWYQIGIDALRKGSKT